MYIKYIQIFRKLEECYDQVVHPQKRRPIRHILDGTMGRYKLRRTDTAFTNHLLFRMLELKHEMLGLELLEFHYFDDLLADLKLTPVCSH